MPETITLGSAQSRRDLRLDVFRGLSLVMIFINHVPGTVFENYTSRNFGFSDAAEGFVLMSGVAAGMAYERGLRAPPYWPGTARVWHRAWTLYLVHLMTVFWAMAIAAATAHWFGSTRLLFANQLHVLFENPLGFLIGTPLLTHQMGYVNILPMYAVLLMATPALLWVALRRPWLLMALSVVVWLLAGLFELDLPNYPNPGGWFFNPLSWQILFVAGLLTGVAARQGRRFIPVRPGLQWAAGLFLLAALINSKVPGVNDAFNETMFAAEMGGVPRFFTVVDKTYVAWPRLLHMLALAYLLSTLPVVRRMAGSTAARPLALLGRQALPVFAFGTILCFVAQAVKDVAPPSASLDTALILGGLSLQLALAFTKDRLSLKGR